jgi:hypothetical protein
MALKYFTLLISTFLFSISSFADTAQVSSTTAAPDSPKGKLYGEFSFSSWQDGMTLNTSGLGSTHLIQTATGICPGVGFRNSISKYAAWDVNGCAFFGTSEIDNDTTVNNGASYASKNNTVYGLQSAAGILFSPGGIKHQIGVEIPFLLRHSNANSAGPGTSFSSATALQTGIQLDTRFYSANSFCVDPKLAWFQTTHTMLWSINFGVDL